MHWEAFSRGGRPCELADIVSLVEFLVSTYISAQVMELDGTLSLNSIESTVRRGILNIAG